MNLKFNKIKIPKNIYSQLENEALFGEENNIIICGIIEAKICKDSILGSKYIMPDKIINYQNLLEKKAIKILKRIKLGLFKKYEIIAPDILNLSEKTSFPIGMYAFYPRNLVFLKRLIKAFFLKTKFDFILLLSFNGAEKILQKEKEIKFGNAKIQLETLKSMIYAFKMNILCFRKEKRFMLFSGLSKANVEIIDI